MVLSEENDVPCRENKNKEKKRKRTKDEMKFILNWVFIFSRDTKDTIIFETST